MHDPSTACKLARLCHGVCYRSAAQLPLVGRGVCAWGGPSTYDARCTAPGKEKMGRVVRPARSAGAGRVRSACVRNPCPVTGMPPMTCPYRGPQHWACTASRCLGAVRGAHAVPRRLGSSNAVRARSHAPSRCKCALLGGACEGVWCGRPSPPHQIPEAPAWQRARQAGSLLMCSAAECGTCIIRGKKGNPKSI